MTGLPAINLLAKPNATKLPSEQYDLRITAEAGGVVCTKLFRLGTAGNRYSDLTLREVGGIGMWSPPSFREVLPGRVR